MIQPPNWGPLLDREERRSLSREARVASWTAPDNRTS